MQKPQIEQALSGCILLFALAACGEDSVGPEGRIAGSIEVQPEVVTIAVGSTVQMTATVLDENGDTIADPTLTWESSVPSVASVDETGTVTGMDVGDAFILVSADSVMDSGIVSVAEPVTLTFVRDEVGLVPGGRIRLPMTLVDELGEALSDSAVVWRSVDESVATVDSAGVISAVAEGQTRIIAELMNAADTATVDVDLLRFTSISSGLTNCGITEEMDLYCWGRYITPHGIHSRDTLSLPIRAAGGQKYTDVSVSGLEHACAIRVDGAAFCWGVNRDGKLGNDLVESSAVPVAVRGSHSFVSILATYTHSCGIVTDGSVYCWGANSRGQLGDGSEISSDAPVRVASDLTFTSISGGFQYTCGLTVDNDAYCWGSNNHAKLGAGAAMGDSAAPVAVQGGHKFKMLHAAEHDYVCGITMDDVLICWGHNDFGQLGWGTTSSTEETPDTVPDVSPVRSVNGFVFHTCAAATDGTGWCWGTGTKGQLGDGQSISSTSPVQVAGGLSFAHIDPGESQTCALTTGALVYCWGLDPVASSETSVPVRLHGQR